jgi:hypothetical protein
MAGASDLPHHNPQVLVPNLLIAAVDFPAGERRSGES